MTAKKKRSKIDWLNHFVGFISVLAGVLIAFGLNNWNESRKERRIIQSVLVNIQDEVKRNNERLDAAYGENKKIHDTLGGYLQLLDDTMEPNAPLDTLRKFQSANSAFISADLESVSFSFELFQLSNVAWRTAERTNILSAMDYDLVHDLAFIYDFQTKLDRFDEKITDEISRMASYSDSKQDWRRMLKDVNTALTFSEVLKQQYNEALETMEDHME